MAPQKHKAATIVVFLEEGAPETHELTSDKDWSVIFEDVLEVKAKEATTYYPLDAVRKWMVRPGRAGVATPVDPGAGATVLDAGVRAGKARS